MKRIPRSGWLRAGVENPESVAEHAFRTALIGYLLALFEGGDEKQAAVICLFHDLSESRISDLDHLARTYISSSNLEKRVIHDQVKRLPPAIGKKVRELTDKYGEETRIARDADRLECAIQAVEYVASGNNRAEDWLRHSVKNLEGDLASKLGNLLLDMYEESQVEDILKWWV